MTPGDPGGLTQEDRACANCAGPFLRIAASDCTTILRIHVTPLIITYSMRRVSSIRAREAEKKRVEEQRSPEFPPVPFPLSADTPAVINSVTGTIALIKAPPPPTLEVEGVQRK